MLIKYKMSTKEEIAYSQGKSTAVPEAGFQDLLVEDLLASLIGKYVLEQKPLNSAASAKNPVTRYIGMVPERRAPLISEEALTDPATGEKHEIYGDGVREM